MRRFLILLTAGVLASSLAMADNDPPGRAARLSYLVGTVSFQPGGENNDWAAAELNRALTTGDKIWVEDGGRTEIQTGNSAIRLNGHTNFSFLNFDDTTTQIQLSLGTAIVRLRGLDEQETYEIDTPQAAFTLLRPGIYRVQVNENGDTTIITVRGGDGETTAAGKADPVHANEQVIVKGADNPSYEKHGLPNIDEFDDWSMKRDSREDSSVSMTKVSRGVPGVADLDVYGAWRPVPTYGSVWFPTTVVADWAPYRFGHWAFVDPWGWTWVDDAPWGYAPFHYGRWVTVGGVWGWSPGPIAVRAVYAPALVSFVGGVEIGVVEPVSWVPLSYGEVFVPYYPVTVGYYTGLNLCGSVFAAGVVVGVWGGAVVNLAFVHNPAAVTVVGRGGFVGGHPCGREFAHRDRFGPHAFDHARFDREGGRRFAASHEGRFGGHAPLRAGGRGFPPRGAMERSVVARHEVGARAGHPGGFRGAGVPARHGPSANAGHPGAFTHNAGGGRPGGPAPMHNTPVSHTPVSHSATPNASHNMPGKSGSPSPSGTHNPAGSGAARPGTPNVSKSGTPGGTHSGSPNMSGSKSSSPMNSGKSGAPGAGGTHTTPSNTTHSNTPHLNTPMGGNPGAGSHSGAPTPGGTRPAIPMGGASHSNTPTSMGGGAAKSPSTPMGSGGAHNPVGGGSPVHTNPTPTHKGK